MPSAIEILITARDEASKTLEGVRNELVLLDQYGRVASDLSQKFEGAEQGLGRFSLSAGHAARATRELIDPIVTGLNPALGQMTSQLSLVVRGATAFGGGATAMTLALGALAGILGGQLSTAWNKSIADVEAWNVAIQGSDPAFFVDRTKTLTEELLRAGRAFEQTRDRVDALTASEQAGAAASGLYLKGLGTGAFADAAPPRTKELELVDKMRAAQQEAEARLSNAQEKAAYDTSAQQAARGPGDTLAVQRANALAQRGLFDYRLTPPEAEYQASLRAAADLARGTGKGEDPDAAARLRDAALRKRNVALGLALSAGEEDLSKVPQIFGNEQDVALAQGAVARGLAQAQGEQDLSTVPRIYGTEQDVQLREQALARRTQELAVLHEITNLEAERLYGGREQLRALEEAVIEQQRGLDLDKAGNNEAQIALANLRAETSLLKLRERNEAIPGFIRGLQTAQDEFGAMGLRMQSLAQNVADGMSRSFSDGFFDVITGNFKDLPNVARSFTQSMVRSVTDELAKLVTAPILGSLRNLFTAGGLGALSIMPGAGAGAGGGPLSFLGPGAAEAASAPVVSVAGRPITNAEINVAFTQAGDQGVRQLQQGQAAVSNGAFITASGNGELPGASIPSGVVDGRGFFSRALPVAGSAAALGLSAYSATQNTTIPGIALSSVMGGLSGAALGSAIASSFPSLGVSTTEAGIGGAVAGAAITAGLAFEAQQAAARQAAKQRQAAEAARAAGAGGDLVSSAGGASSIADLFRRITAFGSGYTGGTANPAVGVTVQTPNGPQAVGTDSSIYPVGGVLDILRNPTSLQAGIQAGVNPALLSGPNAATSKALQDRASDLAAQFRQTEQGVGVTQQDLVPGGLLRRTTVPASRVDQLSPTADLSIDELALNALSDDDKAVLLLDVLGRVAVEKGIQSTISDGATGQIVSITRVARSTVGLPAPTTPVPAPVTTGTTTPAATPLSTGELLTTGARSRSASR
jgi:hypothetical protein